MYFHFLDIFFFSKFFKICITIAIMLNVATIKICKNPPISVQDILVGVSANFPSLSQGISFPWKVFLVLPTGVRFSR